MLRTTNPPRISPQAALSTLVVIAVGAVSLSGCGYRPRAAISGSHLIVQERREHTIYSVDVKTGKTVAAMPGDGMADAPASHGDIVIFHGRGGIVARDMNTGVAKWRVFMNIGDWWPVVASKTAVFVPQMVGATMFGQGDVLRGASASPNLAMSWVSFDLEKGTKRYELKTDPWAPLAANDDIVATIENEELVGYNMEDGNERWRSSIVVKRPLVIDAGHLYARSEDKLAVFNASSGALERRIDLGGTDAFGWEGQQRLAPKGNVVAWIESHVAHVAEIRSGKEVWRKEGADRVVATANVVVVSRGSEIAGLDLGTGSVRWKLALAHDPSSISADGDAIVARVGGSDAVVVDAATGKQRFVFEADSGSSTPRSR